MHNNRSYAPPLSIQRIIKDAMVIMCLLLLNKAGDPGTVVFFLILAGMALRSSTSAFKALAICCLSIFLNKAFVPSSAIQTPARLILPFICFARFLYDLPWLRSSDFFSSRVALTLYCLTMAVCSVMSGWYTNIALLKLLNFWIVLMTIFSGMAIIQKRGIDTTEWFISLITATVFLGFAAIILGQGYNAIPGSGLFNGAFNHPNCYSNFGSLSLIFLMTAWVFGLYRNRHWLILMALSIVIFMILSKSRTSVAAMITGMATIFFYSTPLRDHLDRLRHTNISRGAILILAIVLVMGVVVYDIASNKAFSKAAKGFANKNNETTSDETDTLDFEKVILSRIGTIENRFTNFRKNPIFGIGFQVSADPYFIENATLFSAPVEKGFLPTAILEEGGVVGAIAFIIFIATLIGELARRRNAAGIIMLCAFLASNFSEVTIFSMGGSGTFCWMMVGAAIIMSDHCWRRTGQHAKVS